jgi:hypothetical protein
LRSEMSWRSTKSNTPASCPMPHESARTKTS